MALKILLADDSMTAQNMGKKILADAGYEVIAVSNGAAAIKKISSDRPDIAVVDVYMPGYTGLEVCERVKNAAETARIPVLLTVGKMEPFKVEDANRVRADGVLIKPFEASDLAAAIGAIAKRLGGLAAAAAKAEAEQAMRLPPPPPDETVRLTPDEVEQLDISGEFQPSEVSLNDIQLSQAMASAPAFMDVLEKDHASVVVAPPTTGNGDAASATSRTEAQPVFEIAEAEIQGESAPLPVAATAAVPQPAFHAEPGADDTHVFGAPPQPLSAVPRPTYGWEAHVPEVPFVSAEAAPAPEQRAAAPASSVQAEARPVSRPSAEWMPAGHDGEAVVSATSTSGTAEPGLELETNQPQRDGPPTFTSPPEIEFNSPPQAAVAAEQAPELVVEEVAQVEVAAATDPALVTDPDEMASFSVHVGSAVADDESEHVIAAYPQPTPVATTTGSSEAYSDLVQSTPVDAGANVSLLGEAVATVTEVVIPRNLDDTQPFTPIETAAEENESVAELAERAVASIDPAIAAEVADVTVEAVEPTVVEAPPLSAQDDAVPIHAWLSRTPDHAATVPPASQPSHAPAPAFTPQSVAAATPAAASSSVPTAESVSEDAIARAVMRAIERLRPELIAEITKELGRDGE